MREYTVNYDTDRFSSVIDAILDVFQEHDDFRGCGVQEVYVPAHGFLIFNPEARPEVFGYPLYIDKKLHRGQFLIKMLRFPEEKEKEEEREPAELDDSLDIYYIVTLKPKYQNIKHTTINKSFCGKLINQNDENFYFELNGSKGLVIIPHLWIESMAPSAVLWDIEQKRRGKNA